MKDALFNSDNISFADIAKVHAHRKKAIVITTIVTVSVALLVSLVIRPTYRASTKILLREEKLDPANVLPEYLSNLSNPNAVQDQRQIVQSRPIIAQALKDTGLTNKYLQGAIEQLDVESVQERLLVDRIERTNVLEVKVDAYDAQLAASLANAIVKAYAEFRQANKIKLIEQASNAVEEQIKIEGEKLQLAEEALEGYTRKAEIAILPQQEIGLDLKESPGLDAEITTVDSDIQKVEIVLEEIRKARYSGSEGLFMLPVVVNNPIVQTIQMKIGQAELRLSELLVEYTVNHPEVITVQREIAKLKNDLENVRHSVIATEVEAQRIEKKRLEGKKGVLLQASQDYNQRINKVLFSQPKLAQLLDSVNRSRNIYRGLLDKQRDLSIFKHRAQASQDIKIIETASEPPYPIRPNLILNGFLGLVIGLAIGSSIAVLLPVEQAKQAGPTDSGQLAAQMGWSGRERRLLPRDNLPVKVTYNFTKQPQVEHQCKGNNISESGMSFTTNKKLAKGNTIEVKMAFADQEVISSKAEVIWAAEVSLLENGQGPFNTGVKFIDIDSQAKQQLFKKISQNL